MDSKDLARIIAENARTRGLSKEWSYDDEKGLQETLEMTGLSIEDFIEISITPIKRHWDDKKSTEFICFALMKYIIHGRIKREKHVSTICFCLEQLIHFSDDKEYLWDWVVTKSGIPPQMALDGIKMVFNRSKERNMK